MAGELARRIFSIFPLDVDDTVPAPPAWLKVFARALFTSLSRELFDCGLVDLFAEGIQRNPTLIKLLECTNHRDKSMTFMKKDVERRLFKALIEKASLNLH